MEFTEEQKNYLADVYANGKSSSSVFREAHKRDFIAGFEKALSLLTISEQKKHLSCPHCESSDIDFDENFCTNCSEYID